MPIKITNREFNKLVARVCREISLSNWRPDYVVGIIPTGLVAATMISNYFSVPLYTLNVQDESNLWMSEDAFGYTPRERIVQDDDVGSVLAAASDLLSEGDSYKNILIIDSLNSNGEKFNWIKQDWQASCMPNSQEWEMVWNQNVKFATLIDFCPANMDVAIDYSAQEMEQTTIEFPYENWWA
jgi:hypoxanthine phosphoribosyltransferase